MKTKFSKLTLLTLLASVVVVFTFSACATKVSFLSSSVVPAAKGTVQVSKDHNKNYQIKVKIQDLAGSDRLTPPKNFYVLWLVTADNSTKNIGRINTSKSLSASFETVTVYQPTKIFITAENEADVPDPSYTEVVLTTDFIK